MAFDYSKLRGKIKEKFKTQAEFAKELGISSASLSEKLNEKSDFTHTEIALSCEKLSISMNEVHDYFFCEIG
ncbi:MAG TPA: DUF739 family protein [Oscillospiraceae bacterium]|nr:DUF739 family protein [Oscillospiraceae bacterium]